MSADYELLREYRPWLLKVASGMTTPDRVEDLAQEGWIAMWQAWRSYNGKAPLDYWLKFRARGKMLEVVTKSQSGNIGGYQAKVHAVDSYAPEDMPEFENVTQALELAYHHGEISRALDALTANERRYVIARFWIMMQGKQLNEFFGYNPHSIWKSARPKLESALEHLRGCY